MGTSKPLLSIGLPVYNGERYLRDALDSLISQTFTDFELFISDNSSTDNTPAICQEYARRDARVIYQKNKENIGASRNFNQVFEMCSGKYFKWAAHDDILDPEFLQKCIDVLESDPTVILCYSKATLLNDEGVFKGPYDYQMNLTAPTPHERFHDLIMVKHFCISVFGVIRREYLAKTNLIDTFVGSDRSLLAELGLWGKHVEVPEYLFHRRDHRETSTKAFTQYDRLGWFDPSKRGKLYLPYWRIGLEYFKSVRRVPLPFSEKVRSYLIVIKWFFNRYRALIEDIKGVIVQIFPQSLSIWRSVTAHSRK
jgi:glycosyltransferase involved in cell wall biosynthesis